MKLKLWALLLSFAFSLGIFCPRILAQQVTIDPNTTYQIIRGFGGMSGVGWIDDMTSAEVDLAFGSGNGQIGLSIMRMRIDPDSSTWWRQVQSAAHAYQLGALLFATPWSAPAYMKSNNSLINGGKLLPQYYGAYANHLVSFSNYMAQNNAPLHAVSLQNEPDWHPDYESGDWSSQDFIDFLHAQGSALAGINVMVGESMSFNFALTDPVLMDSQAINHFSIVGGHLYGSTPKDYVLARQKGKDVWMTEYITDTEDANSWPKSLSLASNLHQSMVSNYNAYIWWYIRRSYGLITENGAVSKRGYIMSQFARYVRPGSQRIASTENPYSDVYTTAYKTPDNKTILVVINSGTNERQLQVSVPQNTVASFTKYSTSAITDATYGGHYPVTDGLVSFYVEPQSIATFVSG